MGELSWLPESLNGGADNRLNAGNNALVEAINLGLKVFCIK